MKLRQANGELVLSDGELLKSFYSNQDEAAISIFYNRKYSILQRWALKHLPYYLPARRELAEDLAQEALLLVIRTRSCGSRWDEALGVVDAWIGRILRNLVISRLRKRSELLNSDTPVRADGPTEIDGGRPSCRREEAALDPANMALGHERRDALASALRNLPPSERALLEMSYFADKTGAQIATEMQMSRPTVSRRLSAAKNRLRRCLQERHAESVA